MKEKKRIVKVIVMEKKKNVITAVKSLNDKCQLVRFADYFAICGLDYEAGLEVDRYSGKYTKRK